jgi:hypothetical protein
MSDPCAATRRGRSQTEVRVVTREQNHTSSTASGASAYQDADGIGRAILHAHVVMLHNLATSLAGKGKLIVASFGQDPATGKKLKTKIEHVQIGDVEGTIAAIRRLSQETHRNVYMPFAVMRPDLPRWQKGEEEDVVGVLALVIDFDDADAANYAARLPVTAPYVINSSAGRFQTFLPFDQPVDMAEAKAVAIALNQAISGDYCTVDMSHVWRVPGLLNWPNRKKVVEDGRSPEPQPVLVDVPWDGSTISLDELRKATPKPQQKTTNGTRFDFNGHAADPSDLPDYLRERMRYAPPEGQRSEPAHGVMTTLVEMGWSDDAIFDAAQKYANGFGARYVGDDKRLRADIARARVKAKGDQREWSGKQRQDHGQGGRRDHTASGQESTPEPWSDPLPLVSSDEEPQPYPIDALPPILREACEAYQAFGQQPMALVACSALAAASLATQGLADVERVPGLKGPISLNIIVVAKSGERKTSADKRMSEAIRKWEEDKIDEMKSEVDEARADIAAFNAEKDGLLAKIKAQAGNKSAKAKVEVADIDMLKHDLKVLEEQAPVEPILPDLFNEDVTPEKMAEAMAVGWPSASLWSDEAGLVVGGHGMGDKSLLRYLTLFNRFWDGQPFSRKRSTTKSVTVKGRRLTACLMMQEAVLAQLLAAGDGASRGSGFMARFLMAWPVSTMGGRLYRPGDPDAPALARYDARLRKLLDMPLPVEGEGMVLKPPVLSLSDDAREVWIELHDKVERALSHHAEFGDVADFAAKTADNAARIAGVFHVLESGPVGEIAAETMDDAAELALWHLHDAKRIIGAIEIPEAVADARLLLDWMVAQSKDSIAPREIMQFGPPNLRVRARRDAAIQLLVDTNHLCVSKVDNITVLHLNPKLRGGR